MKKIKYYFNLFSIIKKFILDILLPVECIGCGQDNIWLCQKCLDKILINTEDICPVCKKYATYGETHTKCIRKTFLAGMLVATEKNNKLLKRSIHLFKYNFIKELAEPFGELLINKIKQILKETQPKGLRFLIDDNWLVIPVPLHKRRLRWRGFNQTELLAEIICQEFKLVLENNILIRKKYTVPQAKLKRIKRLKNIQKAFDINKKYQDKITNTKILLVDDISTTGATLNECAKILKKYGAKEVWGIVLSRG